MQLNWKNVKLPEKTNSICYYVLDSKDVPN